MPGMETYTLGDGALKPGNYDIYWYECYGLGAQENPGQTLVDAIAFDPRLGWSHVRCTTVDGTPMAPMFRSTLAPGDRGPKGR